MKTRVSTVIMYAGDEHVTFIRHTDDWMFRHEFNFYRDISPSSIERLRRLTAKMWIAGANSPGTIYYTR